jgi:hypothetical protein
MANGTLKPEDGRNPSRNAETPVSRPLAGIGWFESKQRVALEEAVHGSFP